MHANQGLDNSEQHPLPASVRTQVQQLLAEMEQERGIRILYAAESGSRAWGFASPDSDFDVRFVYKEPVDWYLRVRPGRDVIELHVDARLDISGWELRKALQLLAQGNVSLVEWLNSPLRYREDGWFCTQQRALVEQVYRPERGIYHYLHMARGNYRTYLQRDPVRLKKYLYVLRPLLLAALWLERGLGMPPIVFEALVKGLVTDPELIQAIAELLARKRSAGELAEGRQVPVIQAFLGRELELLERDTPELGRPPLGLGPLDRLLRESLLRDVSDGAGAAGAPPGAG